MLLASSINFIFHLQNVNKIQKVKSPVLVIHVSDSGISSILEYNILLLTGY